ncbi:MAG: 30S ribosomal protein S9 [Planctomycetes bacterium RIFOXYD2_FULL_41_16]|uniref:30S ribosomal protein S9 n=1 Tax=Candidatus Wunengus californicus TaxID=3367619 RepID=UPI0008D631DE|nr:30S ribosomal protein S9 [Planctomycetota bacterium]OHB46499.1 MAG: 30S ribosomal protein S9 [Planctomycetes bacterium GWE2_41_14]OHB99010.1 MAG: 30S ribosomal protein S9 [Planctomycetes bacterium RIFCSPHIGHO2_12_42_15]OHC06976.1 MAG: 30S ribosomal protein S9 [Planctomycetes bacterium RIFOXYC2_FULL_41_27]OHC07467.1 MAG: 30S ribosomal protein S9 [Planctomycetes bacterium RIFOXYD2_FULL_41_16]
MAGEQYIWGTGRRKTSIARVRIKKGNGKILVNDKDLDSYFPIDRERGMVRTPLKTTKTLGEFDVLVNVKGGGLAGQAGAISLGIARALCKSNPNLVESLRDGGFLTRDSRMKERKKYGQKGARKSFQWTKR